MTALFLSYCLVGHFLWLADISSDADGLPEQSLALEVAVMLSCWLAWPLWVVADEG